MSKTKIGGKPKNKVSKKTNAPILTSEEVRKIGKPIEKVTGSEAQDRVMNILRRNAKPMTASQIVEATNFEMSEQYVNNTIYKLQAKNFVSRFLVKQNGKKYIYNELI